MTRTCRRLHSFSNHRRADTNPTSPVVPGLPQWCTVLVFKEFVDKRDPEYPAVFARPSTIRPPRQE